MSQKIERRNFLSRTARLGLFGAVANRPSLALGINHPNDRPRVGVVGTGSRWDQRATLANGPHGLGKEFPKFSDIVAVCDVDAQRVERARGLVKDWLKEAPRGYSNYRDLIERDDIDIVHIVTPDHWHAKVAIEAMLAGKDVYCEKPMTLTIEEGRLISQVQKKTGRIMQVGTQQRSQRQMLTAIAMIRDGRLGKLKKVQCAIGGAPTSPKLAVTAPPRHFDWNQWVGPAPLTDFHFKAGARNEVRSWSRSHYEFRWWYEYSGGKLTDWGAHHVDIATWGMDKTDSGPVSVDPLLAEHPVEFKDGYPVQRDCYNTATRFNISCKYADGMELVIRHDTGNGILFEGTEGRVFVNRGRLTGKPAEELKTRPLSEEQLEKIYKDRPLTDHLANFFAAVSDRREPVSDVHSHHRALSTCHLAGIAARLGRKIRWNPIREEVIGDAQAQSFVAREKRKGFEIQM
ncbi:MAG: Gfo/Idh/MocA family oxidoreductase [Planctomycetota bacterium]|nr:Gfo/Idh/MocA family oxidoreductase [Planctomycetota bacterium]